jgi:hypothetical protein
MLIFFLGFAGMTYEFILRLCGKSPFCPELKDVENKDDAEPPEPANVPKTPNDPDDVLEGAAKFDDKIEGAEEVEDEDGNTTIEYVFTTDNDPLWNGYWTSKGDTESIPGTEIERTH